MKAFKTKAPAEALKKQMFVEYRDLGRSNVLSTSALAECRKGKGIIQWLFLVIVLGASLCGNTSVAQPADNITVMSFNILRQAWQPTAPSWDTQRKADVIQTIQNKSPDFVGTQEENDGQMEDIIAALPAYSEVPGRGVSGGILYLQAKWDLVDSGKTLFVRYDEGNSKDRYFIWGLFSEKTTNRMIYVYSNHLPGFPNQATTADRVAGMEQMATHAANRVQGNAPVILTGDFNAKASDDPMKTLTGEIGSLPINFVYAYQDSIVTDVSYGIDHILALPGTIVVDSGVAAAMKWDSGSDHPAVFAVIEPWFGSLSGYPDASARVEAIDSTATEEGETTATFSVIREGDTSSALSVNFSISGTATEGDDYALSASSPITIPAGQSSADIIVTPTDDIVFGERSETVTLTITAGTGYDEFGAPATATIEDNDNHAPVVNAGVDRHIVFGESAWSPAEISTTAWYDAADTSSITANASGQVSQWDDKSGNANNATQATASNQPTTEARTINALNVLDFDPTGPNYLLTPLEQLTTVSMYVVGEYEPRGSNAYGGFIGANAAGSSATGVAQGLVWRGENYSDGLTRADDPQYVGNTPVADRYVDGSAQAEMNFNVAAIYSHQGSGLGTVNRDYFIGMSRGDFSTVWALKGSIGEIIICPEEHDLANRQKIEGYLAHKWGLATNLPVGHPYKAAAPLIPLASVQLSDANIEDEDLADPLTQTWTIVSKPAGAPDPVFLDGTVLNAQVAFYELGTYTLRLTADDGYGPTSDEVTILVSDSGTFPKVSVTATEAAVSETQPDTGAFTITRTGDTATPLDVYFTLGGSATEIDDYTIDANSPATIPVGETSINIILTPVDDVIYSEGLEVATLTIAFDSGYTTGTAFDSITIADNDNFEPVADAGTPQTVYLDQTTPWTPADIATTAWFDASDTDKITASGNAVSVWQDKSGNGNDATQGTPANQPATGGAINGLNAISFNPDVNHYLTTGLEQLTNVSMYIVVDATSRGPNYINGPIGACLEAHTDNGFGWSLANYADGAVRNTVTYEPGDPSNLLSVYSNGVLGGNHNFQPALLSHQGTGLTTINLNYHIGNGRQGTGWDGSRYKGLIGEIIICPEEHDLANRQKMEGYLAHKWGLTANLPVGHPYKDSAPQSSTTAASVTLTGATVSDADAGDILTQSWELVSKPAGAPDPTFSSTTVINPTVTFTAAGTYELRLTASDGYATHSDNVTIDVYSQQLSQYWAWADGSFANAFTGNGIDFDHDGDGLDNLLEFAFGTDPTVGSGSALATDGSAHGQPKVAPNGADMELFFVRRKDHGTSGSVTYSLEFSGDLVTFFASAVEPSFVANSGSDADYEVVKVAFPVTLPDSQEARFGRIVIEPTP